MTHSSFIDELHIDELFFKAIWIKKKIVDIYSKNTVFIIVSRNNIFSDDNLLKRIVDFPERSNLLCAFCFVWQGVRRLNIVSGGTKIAYKIHLQLLAD